MTDLTPEEIHQLAHDLREVEVSQLRTDESYQRGTRNWRVEILKAKWDKAKAGVILVSERKNGLLYIMDGGHRAAAAKEKGERTLSALAYTKLTVQDEAAIYHATNNDRWAVGSIDLFKARVTSGDKSAIAILKTLDENGLGVAWQHNRQDTTAVTAIKAIEETHAWGVLSPTLRLLTSIWPHQKDALGRTAIMGMGSLVLQYSGKLDEGRLKERLQRESIIVLLQAAKGLKHQLGGAEWDKFAQVILKEYNRGLGANKLDRYVAPRPSTSRASNVAGRGHREIGEKRG